MIQIILPFCFPRCVQLLFPLTLPDWATITIMLLRNILHHYTKLPVTLCVFRLCIHRCGGTSLCVWEKERLIFGFISARRLTLLTPLLRHLQLPIVCIRLSAVCVSAESATDLSLNSRYNLYVRRRSSSATNHLYVIELRTSQDATTKTLMMEDDQPRTLWVAAGAPSMSWSAKGLRLTAARPKCFHVVVSVKKL